MDSVALLFVLADLEAVTLQHCHKYMKVGLTR